jgi:hypothetical protein
MEEDWFATTRIYISPVTLEKLWNDHKVSQMEVEEAIFNSARPYLVERRPRHRTTPPSIWFLAPTAEGRLLKVIFRPYFEFELIHVKSAYEPEDYEIAFYQSQT